MTIKVEAAKVFTSDPETGNLAGVVLDAACLPDRTMQQIAKAVNASETSFVLPSDRADLRVRWFTPNCEVGICVHATIAAIGAWVAEANDQRRSFTVETRNAVLRAERDGSVIYINVPGYSREPQVLDQNALAELFGLEESEIAGPVGVIRIYEDRELVLPVRSIGALASLRPDVHHYAEICRKADVTGLCLFSKGSYAGQHDVHVREFAPLYGYLEDPLCGMAAGCVLTHLRSADPTLTTLKIEQGHFCQTAGTIFVKYVEESGLWIGGEYTFAEPLEIAPTSAGRT